MSDSRVEKLATRLDQDYPGAEKWHGTVHMSDAQATIDFVESAGLVVSDPADPAVIDRVARALFLEAMPGHEGAWDAPGPAGRASWRIKARAVLAALGGDQPEPPVSLSVQRRLDVMRGDRGDGQGPPVPTRPGNSLWPPMQPIPSTFRADGDQR